MNHAAQDHSAHSSVTPERLEAFSDGVMAIIITIAALELKAPLSTGFSGLASLAPFFIAYAVSFQTVGTYWNNHHHLLRLTKHISASIMWTNLNLLFWLSLIPFATGWLGESPGGSATTALYALILLMCALSYTLLQWRVVAHSDNREELSRELKKSPKGVVSLACYALAAAIAFYSPLFADVLIILVAIMWFIPDKRLERYI